MPKYVVPRASRAGGFTTRLLGVGVVLAACAASYWVGASRTSRVGTGASAMAAATTPGFRAGSIGAWGQLELLRTELEPPPSLILTLKGDVPPWFFPGYTRERVL